MNITIHSTIYAVYKKCRNESPLERSFIKAYFSLDQAKKAVRKTIFQLTDALMTTRNVITDHSTTPEGGEQYKVITAPKNSINPYHRLECIMYIQPYSLTEDEETESETEGNTTETECEEEENVSTFGCGTTGRCCYNCYGEDHLSYNCPHPIQDDKDETVIEEDQPPVDHHLDGVQIDRSEEKDDPSVVFMGSAYMKHMDEIQRFDRNELSNVNHNRSSDVDRPSDDRYLPAGQVDPPKAISEADKRLRDTKEAAYLAGLYDGSDEDRPPLVDHELVSEEEEEDVEVEPTTSLGHYLNGFGISSFGIGRK